MSTTTLTDSPVERFLARLDDAGCDPRPTGDGKWKARCPGHDDEHASLAIGVGDDGKVLVTCFAGCALESIVAGVNMTVPDLFPKRAEKPAKRERGRVVKTYDYLDAAGVLLFQCVRFEPKDFKQRRPDGKGDWIWNLDGTPRVLYCLPELLAADPAEWVFVVEGEKDVDNLRAVGLVATCNPMGAGKWANLSDDSALHGRRVCIIPDRDEAGHKHAEDVAKRLHGRAAEVKLIECSGDGIKDASDWLTAHDAQSPDELCTALVAMAEAAPVWTPTTVPAEVKAEDTFEAAIHLTDLGNARRFAREHGENVHHVPQWGAWLVWDGRCWARDETGEVNRLAARTVANIYREGADTPDKDTREALIKHALKSESAAAIHNLLTVAESVAGTPVMPAALDSDPWLLNALNGTVDLRTGNLHPHRRADLITKLAAAPYDPMARSELWESVLLRTQRGDAERVAFLRRAFGSALVGCNPDDRLYFVNGPKGSGKTTVIEAVGATLGDYGKTASFESFLAKREAGSHTAGLVPLVGARYVWSSETDAGRAKRFAEGVLNLMAGGDTMRLRDLYEKSFQTKVTWKVFLAANARPRLTDDERDGIWRRMTLVEFPDEIPKAEVRPAVRAALTDPAQSGAAILAWLVAGCLAWQAEGLRVPESVEAATVAYRLEQDPLTPFLADCCAVRESAMVPFPELWQAWENYAGKGAMSRTAFGRRLAARGFTKDRTGGGRILTYLGLELLP